MLSTKWTEIVVLKWKCEGVEKKMGDMAQPVALMSDLSLPFLPSTHSTRRWTDH